MKISQDFLDLVDGPGRPQSVVVPYYERLKESYLQARRAWCSGLRTVARRDVPTLTRLAEELYNAGIDPAEFVLAAFEHYAERRGEVYVPMLLAPVLFSGFEEVRKNLHEKARVALVLQLNALNNELRNGASLRTVLLDEQVGMGGLFRYVVAKTNGMPELLPEFEQSAREIVRFNPSYWAFLRDVLPREWEDEFTRKVQGSDRK